MRMSGEKTQYAFLTDGCKQIFGTWSGALNHMRQECNYNWRKPNIKQSKRKAAELTSSDPELAATAVAESVLPKPWDNVPEEELVELVRSHYARTDPFGQTQTNDGVRRSHSAPLLHPRSTPLSL